jgi:hypothetical protein
MSKVLSIGAIFISLLASGISFFSIYKLAAAEQKLETLTQTLVQQQQMLQTAQNATSGQPTRTAAPQAVVTDTSTTTGAGGSDGGAIAAIQPGQFVNPAFENDAQVELLSVKRITNPNTQERNVVNIQFRVRKVGDFKDKPASRISASKVAARSSDTSEAFNVIYITKRNTFTDPMTLNLMEQGASADAYVWLEVPEAVKTLDIYIPETQAFKGVAIAD